MASIESLGIGSGLLTTELAENLINAERGPAEARLDAQKSLVEARISAYGELKAKMDEFGSAASDLSSSKSILKTTATSSNEDAITATTNSLAKPGSYIMEVEQVAQNHSLASKRFEDLTTTLGSGVMTFKFGETQFTDPAGDYDEFIQDIDQKTQSITISSANNTISGIRDAINKENFGVTASLVNDGEGYRLLLTSDQSGKDYSMEISVSGSSSLKALSYNENANDPDVNMKQTQNAQNAEFTLNGLEISSKNNEVDEVIKGVTFDLKQANIGEPATVRVKQDTDELTEKVQGFVDSYNEFRDLYKNYSKYNTATNTGGLLNDSTLRNIDAQMRRVITGAVTGMEGASFQSLSQIGIYSDQNNNYALTLDNAKFSEAMKTSSIDVAGVFSVQGNTSDSLIEYISPGYYSKAGTYDVEIEKVATQASITTTPSMALAFMSTIPVDANNDQFTINLDGTEAEIFLTHGLYTNGEDLADMIQAAINNNDALSKKGSSITVSFNAADQNFEFTSSKFGSKSELAIVSSDINTGSTLGIITGNEGNAKGNYISNLSQYNFSATTLQAEQEVLENTGIDFSSDNASFTLNVNGTSDVAVDGVDISITLDEDISDQYDSEGNVSVDKTREDVLAHIQAKIDETVLNGHVTASFNNNNRLVFSTAETAGTQSIEIKTVGTNVTDSLLGLNATNGPQNSGLNLTGGAAFQLSYTNQTGTTDTSDIAIPDGLYETSGELTAAIENAINTHADVINSAAPAKTEAGTTSYADPIDFATNPMAFEFEYNGDLIDVEVTNFDTDNLTSIQAALTAALGGADVTASFSSNKLVLTTNANGSTETLNVTKNGDGAKTAIAGVTPLAATNFASSNTTFDLIVDGKTISVDVIEDGSDSVEDSLAAVQSALNDALESVDGGDSFDANDILAKLDDTGHLYFETQSARGVQTSATFGAQSTISIANASPNAKTLLDLDDGVGINGFNSPGIPQGLNKGFNATASVSYEQNDQNEGRIVVSFDEDTNTQFANINVSAASMLGLAEPDGDENESVFGIDVKGKINGIEAKGSGQYLVAADGSVAATQGHIISNTVDGFSTPITTNPTDYSFKIKLNGLESNTITLDAATYSSGKTFASTLQGLINDDAKFKTEGYKVVIDYDDDLKKFGIQSNEEGANSSVNFSELSSLFSTMTGFTTANQGVQGTNSSGSVDDAAGLQLKVSGGPTGERGTVSYIKGAADSLKSLINSFLKNDGVMTTKINDLENEIVDIEEDRTKLNERLDSSLDRLKRQFLFNDKIISSLKTTENFLTQQFEAMAASNKK
ncbi:flagellar filament capping protein FliD [Marinicellulosiphila megalodicopiae]|uniref:flagellar filament capping protein FliD n=1 Tax=Marinicellulosiphila megalodicopiae TaxID=2724896 RepID=UPI003BAFC9C6